MKTQILILTFLSVTSLSLYAQSTSKRNAQVDKILSQTQQLICNPHFLQSVEWTEFTSTIEKAATLKLTDQEFARLFNQASRKLPFTHYYLNYTGAKTKRKARPPFALEEIDSTTGMIRIATWAKNAAAMQAVINEIEAKGYTNLIIDLRNNTGGTLDAAVVLGQFLTNQTIDAGTYLTRSWFEQTADYPTKEQVETFPFLTDMSYEGFGAMMQKPAFRMVIPGHKRPVFKGEVMVLINNNTASTNEPLVQLIQQEGLGTLVGQKTAGAMMSGSYVKISRKLRLFLPVADYVNAAGVRLDKVGVTPDVDVASNEALDKALQLLSIN